ncbi:MAG: methyltransferase [Candidatus Syntrophosphaera sp.]|nr:methyltransferase [Candidatus Syntrophosphaera sp.]
MDLDGEGLYILQDAASQAVSHASDSLRKAALALRDEQQLRVLELGSGCGIVSIMLALARPGWEIEALEIQPELHALACENASRLGLQIQFLLSDLRQYSSDEPYSLIVSNPPWQKTGSGRYSPLQSRNVSRFELECALQDVLDCVRRNLAPEGDALLLYPASRAEDIRVAAAKTLLDIISLSPAAGLKRHLICHIRHKGQAR